MPSRQLQLASQSLRKIRDQLSLANLNIAERRELFDALPRRYPPPTDINVDKIVLNGVPTDRLGGDWSHRDLTILYFHGGGYVACSPATHRELAGRIGRECNATVYVPDYRLAPEFPYPAAINDAVSSYEALLELNGGSAREIVVAGDSAGGGLTASLLLMLRDRKRPLPRCACLLSPWADLTLSSRSMIAKAEIDPMITPDDLKLFADHYVSEMDRTDPLVSPLLGDLTGFPPLLIQVGTDEILLDDALGLAANAARCGVSLSLEVEKAAFHVWQSLPHLPEAVEATNRIGSFVKRHC